MPTDRLIPTAALKNLIQFSGDDVPITAPYQPFFITFGQKLRYDPHPVYPGKVSVDGYVRVLAKSFEHAMAIAIVTFGQGGFSMVRRSKPDQSLFPDEMLGAFDTHGKLHWTIHVR